MYCNDRSFMSRKHHSWLTIQSLKGACSHCYHLGHSSNPLGTHSETNPWAATSSHCPYPVGPWPSLIVLQIYTVHCTQIYTVVGKHCFFAVITAVDFSLCIVRILYEQFSEYNGLMLLIMNVFILFISLMLPIRTTTESDPKQVCSEVSHLLFNGDNSLENDFRIALKIYPQFMPPLCFCALSLLGMSNHLLFYHTLYLFVFGQQIQLSTFCWSFYWFLFIPYCFIWYFYVQTMPLIFIKY